MLGSLLPGIAMLGLHPFYFLFRLKKYKMHSADACFYFFLRFFNWEDLSPVCGLGPLTSVKARRVVQGWCPGPDDGSLAETPSKHPNKPGKPNQTEQYKSKQNNTSRQTAHQHQLTNEPMNKKTSRRTNSPAREATCFFTPTYLSLRSHFGSKLAGPSCAACSFVLV